MVRLVLILFCCLLLGCNSNRVWKDVDINKHDRDIIAQKVNEICYYILSKDSHGLYNLGSGLLNTDLSFFDSVVNTADILDTASKKVIGEFLVSNSNDMAIRQVNTYIGPYRYAFDFVPTGRKTYIYLFVVPNKKRQFEWLISTTFNKENEEWKLTGLIVGPYSYKDKIAPELYAQSKIAFQKGNLTYASYYMNLVADWSYPAGKQLHYELEQEMQNYNNNELQPALARQHSFPIIVDDIDTKPEILASNPFIYNGIIYPKVYYKTYVRLDDSISLRKENNQLHKVIDSIFPKYTTLADTILYEAMDGLEYNSSNHVEFIQLGDKSIDVL